VVDPERVEQVTELCAKWEVNAAAIGEVTDTQRLRVFCGDRLVGDMPVGALVDECPLYDLEPQRPEDPLAPYRSHTNPDSKTDLESAAESLPGGSPEDQLLLLLGSSNIASRRWAFEQYDCLVGGRTVRRAEQADAAVLRLAHEGSDTGRAIAVSIDGNGRRVACDPYVGAAQAVVECAANLACVGAAPLGLTNCLNFGNPSKPHVAWQLEQAVAGIGAACRALGVPVVGGNVSLYNEGNEGPIYPSPIVGMVGELERPERAAGTGFRATAEDAEPDQVALVGPFQPSLAGSELAKLDERLEPGLDPFDLAAARDAIEIVRGAVAQGKLSSAHDVAEGGIAACLAECAIVGGVGAVLDLAPLMRQAEIDPTTALFGEGPAGFLVSGPRSALLELSSRAAPSAFLALGSVGGGAIRISAGDATIDVSIESARSVFELTLAERLP
jgi:phosphoribosylformylglycinamidine synthase subunit PurL